MRQNEPVDMCMRLVKETLQAYLVAEADGTEVWLAKSQLEYHDVKTDGKHPELSFGASASYLRSKELY